MATAEAGVQAGDSLRTDGTRLYHLPPFPSPSLTVPPVRDNDAGQRSYRAERFQCTERCSRRSVPSDSVILATGPRHRYIAKLSSFDTRETWAKETSRA